MGRKGALRGTAGIALGLALLGGCASHGGAAEVAQPLPSPSVTVAPPAASPDPTGVIPVLMFHQIISRPGRDDMTAQYFQAELDSLYQQNYRPITAADLVARRIDLPIGSHPIVLTFDDSTVSQARIGSDGNPRPDTALGMLEAFGREHPDFHPTATFYINTYPPPFVDDKVLPWLAAHGYEIGAHTHSHANLAAISDAAVQRQVGGNVQEIEALVPGYHVTTMALPYGNRPRNRALALDGTYNGTPYHLLGEFGVDEIAAPSPFSDRFFIGWIPRVGGHDATRLLAQLQRHPERLYTVR